nr:hypothetical protein [uncultured Sphingorhabdus sp.]
MSFVFQVVLGRERTVCFRIDGHASGLSGCDPIADIIIEVGLA